MSFTYSFKFLLFAGILFFTQGIPVNNCVWYPSNDDINWEDGRDRLCTNYNNRTICKEWKCPVPDCEEPETSEYGICTSYCNGTCTYGGKVPSIGEGFISPDGYNTCWCGEKNTYFCSYAGFTVETMCNIS